MNCPVYLTEALPAATDACGAVLPAWASICAVNWPLCWKSICRLLPRNRKALPSRSLFRQSRRQKRQITETLQNCKPTQYRFDTFPLPDSVYCRKTTQHISAYVHTKVIYGIFCRIESKLSNIFHNTTGGRKTVKQKQEVTHAAGNKYREVLQ